ncbi:uncharacterized protein LOC142321005 [Lycorma delicatula]|uniref:uncharacterized protein LOC142321005 n=1 Tax=Lycorma delicatula TaxID=130591 RepID=UPI003F50EC93
MSTDLSQYKSNQIRLLMVAVERTLEKITDAVTIEEFREKIQKIESLKQKQKRINKLYSLLKIKIIDSCMNEFKEAVEEDNLDDKFCELDEIIKSNADNGTKINACRPPGDVSEHIRSHFMLVKLKQKRALELYVKEKEESVKNLLNTVQTMRDKAHEMENKIVELSDLVCKSNNEWEEILTSFRTA